MCVRIIFSFLIMIGVSTFGSTHQPEIGTGFTSNANYTDQNPKSDSYLFLKHFSYFSYLPFSPTLGFSYKHFSQTSQNNVLNWRGTIRNALPELLGTNSYGYLGLGGQNFTSKNPQTTDEGFNNIYLELALVKTATWNKVGSWSFEPGYQFKRFEDTYGRREHKIYFNNRLDIDLNFKHMLTPMLELSFVNSTDPLYSRNYFDIGVEWFWQMTNSLELTSSLFSRSSWFPNRKLTSPPTITAINKNKKNSSLSQNEIESQNYTQLEVSILKTFKNINAKGTIMRAYQDSRSNTENFEEYVIQGSLIFPF